MSLTVTFAGPFSLWTESQIAVLEAAVVPPPCSMRRCYQPALRQGSAEQLRCCDAFPPHPPQHPPSLKGVGPQNVASFLYGGE